MKITDIIEATTHFLEGTLKRFSVESIDKDIYEIRVLYQDKFDFNYDYDFEINKYIENCRFIGHHILSSFYEVTLNREESFENEIYHILKD